MNAMEIMQQIMSNNRVMGNPMIKNAMSISDIEPIKRQCVYEDNKPCNSSCRYSNTCIHSANKTEE